MSGSDSQPNEVPGSPNNRHLSRRQAVQALYQWMISWTPVKDLLSQFAIRNQDSAADEAFFRHLVTACTDHKASLDALIDSVSERPVEQLDVIEHAVLLVAAFEMRESPEVPYRAVIDESVKLAKLFGGTDGHKFVNGVVDKLAQQVRPQEVG